MRKRRGDSGGEVVSDGVGGGELFIAVNGCAVHKDCCEGYPEEKGGNQEKAASTHLNKRMERETRGRKKMR